MYKKKKEEIYEKADSPRDNFLGLKVTNETFNTNSSNHYNTDLSIPILQVRSSCRIRIAEI